MAWKRGLQEKATGYKQLFKVQSSCSLVTHDPVSEAEDKVQSKGGEDSLEKRNDFMHSSILAVEAGEPDRPQLMGQQRVKGD